MSPSERGMESISVCHRGTFFVPCFNDVPGGVIVGNASPCCCVPVVRVASSVRALLPPFVCSCRTVNPFVQID